MTNTAAIEGNLQRDPRVFPLKDGKGILARFCVTVPRQDMQGLDFIDCVAFGEAATTINDHAQKGTAVKLDGSIRSGRYQKNGSWVYTTEIAVNTLQVTARGRITAPTETDAETEPTSEDATPKRARAKSAA